VKGPILVVAANTFREVARDRMLHLLGALIVAFVLFSRVLGWLAVEEVDEAAMLVDFGLAGVNVFGLLMTVLLGASLLRREMEQRTLYTVLSREVSRTEFVVGKYLGLLAVFGAGLAAVAVLMAGYQAFWGQTPGLPVAVAVYGNLLEIALLVAATVFLGSFTTPAMASLGTVALYVSGHSTETLREFLALRGEHAPRLAIEVLYHAVPNLTDFNYRNAARYGDAVPIATLGAATAYAAIWVALLLGAAALLFRRRELP